MTDSSIQLDSGGSYLFVGNSFTFGRVDPVMSYNTGNVRDLTAPVPGTTFANTTGANPYEPHPWGGVPGLFEAFASQAGLELDVAISARNAATLQGQYLNSNPAGWDLRGNVASQAWDVVVLQDNSTQPLPSGSGSITFAAGSSTATLTIDPTANTKMETDETIGLQVTVPANGTYRTSSGVVTGTILNDDPTGPVVNPNAPTVTLVANPGAVLEDGTPNLVYTFTRTGSTASALTVTFAAARDGGNAPSITEYTSSFQSNGVSTTGSLSFTTGTGSIVIRAGASSATFTLDPIPDTGVENDESIRLTLSSNAAYNVGTQGAVAVTILNDDFAPGTDLSVPNISLSLASSGVYEDGAGNLVYQFTRSGSNAAPLTVNFSVSGTATVAGNDFTVTGANSFSTAGAADPNLQSFNTYAVKLAQYATTGSADAANNVPANTHANAATDVYLYETWARPNMITGALVANTNDTTGAVTNTTTTAPEFYLSLEAMTADLKAAYQGLAAANSIFAGVAPVGEAFLAAVQNGTAMRDPYAPNAGADGKIDLWWDDNLHASKYGSYLSGLTLFGKLTGLDPRSLGAAEHVAADLGITPAVAAALQGIAAATLGFSLDAHWTAPGQVTELPGGVSGLLATEGSFGFSDSDIADTHTIAVAALTPGSVGTFTAGLHTDTTGDGTGGSVDWLFTADNAAVAFLAPGATRVEHFLVTISDAHGGLAQRDVAITLNGTYNDAPVAHDDAYTANEDTALIVPANGVLGNDTDDSPSLSSILVSGPAHGSLTLNAGGSFSYTPGSDYNGSDSFTYKANDGSADSNVATVHISVNPVNDAPVATDDAYTTNEDTALIVPANGVLGNDTDVDSPSLSSILVSGPAHGSLTLNAGGSFTYTPGSDYNGSDSFTYKANDGSADSNVATVHISVNPVNDAPVAQNAVASGNEDTPIMGQLSANDVDNTSSQLSYSIVGQALHGSLSVNPDGTYVYTPGHDFNGTDSFSFHANDGSLDSNAATVALTINAVNDAPNFTTPAHFVVPENSTAVGTVMAVDPEHDAFLFSVAGGDDASFFAIDVHTGALSFLNSPDFETPEDANHDNVYDVLVSARDTFGATNTQAIKVGVTDLAEPGRTINGGNGDDTLLGTAGKDTINGGNGDDRIDGGDGDDVISGSNGNDILIGGRGNNTLDGGDGNDTLTAGNGNNVLTGGNGNDVLTAGNGNNSLDGGNGNDVLKTGNGNDLLTGGNGDDVLNGGGGNDVLTGSNGNDKFVFAANLGKDTVTDFSHGDTIEFAGVFHDFQALMTASHQVGADTVITVDANDSVTLQHVTLGSLHASDFHLV